MPVDDSNMIINESGGNTQIADQERFTIVKSSSKGSASKSTQLNSIDNKHPRRVMDKVAQLQTIILTMDKRMEQLEENKREDHQA